LPWCLPLRPYFHQWTGLTVLSQMGIAIIACLSYNMLLGQGGMLSFGHAVYTGLGLVSGDSCAECRVGWVACRFLSAGTAGGWRGRNGLCVLLLGYVTTRKAGTTLP
jgi:branched-chain amino acid transport system permease protein